METSPVKASSPSWLDRPLADLLPKLNTGTLLITVILVLTIFSRFYIVGQRVMSHDEVNHVVPSYDLLEGRGYRHDPITHGPFQFHIVALSYFILGDSDFSARVPAVLFSIATVALVMLLFPRYLGKAGAIIAGFLFLISPYMLFYGRYTRNEAFVALYGVLTIFAILRYLDRGDRLSLFLLTGATVMHFVTKETSFIYTAQVLLFVAFVFIDALARVPWPTRKSRNGFLLLFLTAILLFGIALGFGVWNAANQKNLGEEAANLPGIPTLQIFEFVFLAAAVVVGIIAIFWLIRKLGFGVVRAQRSFDLLILMGTMILPMLAPFPVKILGNVLGTNWNPIDYTNTSAIIADSVTVIVLTLIAVAIGLWWKPKLWLANFALFYGIFTVFYTTMFTNGFGFVTGLVGSLGYWLEQQGVQRGEQPLYYYALVQIPIYEFLAALGTLVAAYFGLRYRRFSTVPGYSPALQPVLPVENESEPPVLLSDPDEPAQPVEVRSSLRTVPVLSLLLFWAFSALAAYSIAGEKMPWLTVHIALPMLLAAGWGLGILVDTTPWKKLLNRPSMLAVILLVVLLLSAFGTIGSLLGTQPPFQGNSLEQLRATSTFLFSLITAAVSAAGLGWIIKDYTFFPLARLAGLLLFAVLAVITIRTAVRANYIYYDYPFEYLVYAHAGPGPKQVLEQVEEISQRTTGGKEIAVAYDNNALYPYWWYFRDYPNKRWFGGEPTRDLREAPLIIAGTETMAKVDSITGEEYIHYDYKRLWWPNQDYFNLDWPRIREAITNPQIRAAVFDIWLNRDYSAYAALKGDPELTKQFTLANWAPSENMRFYIRKDVVSQIWNYGVAPSVSPIVEQDPYAEQIETLQANSVIGGFGTEPGLFNTPHGMSFAPDGSVYIADAVNHRIQHLSENGEVLQFWGSFADIAQGDAPGGTFYEPWDVAVGPDGSVYVADTWNHRIQKFTAEGQIITHWGYFGQAEQPEAFWGPRDILVDGEGRVFVADTGNRRIVIFDSDGQFITEFGSEGFDPGQFSEPMGMTLDTEGKLYVVDTWNQRIQVFTPQDGSYVPFLQWDVYGWFGKSLQNYPFIASDANNNIYITDPEGYRVLQFTSVGDFVRGWGGYSTGADGFGLPSGLAFDPQGRLWVSDAGNHTLLRFDFTAEQP